MLTLLSSYSNSFSLSYYEGVPSSTNTPNVCDDIVNTPNAPYCKTTTTNKTLKVQVLDLVNSVNNFLYVLVPSIAVIAVIVGAFNILQNSVKVGILIIQWALIGMVVVLLSSALISLVIKIFVGT